MLHPAFYPCLYLCLCSGPMRRLERWAVGPRNLSTGCTQATSLWLGSRWRIVARELEACHAAHPHQRRLHLNSAYLSNFYTPPPRCRSRRHRDACLKSVAYCCFYRLPAFALPPPSCCLAVPRLARSLFPSRYSSSCPLSPRSCLVRSSPSSCPASMKQPS